MYDFNYSKILKRKNDTPEAAFTRLKEFYDLDERHLLFCSIDEILLEDAVVFLDYQIRKKLMQNKPIPKIDDITEKFLKFTIFTKK